MAINHAPKRKDILTDEEKVLAVRNALRYFPTKFHSILAEEFAQELHDYGRIYMYRFRPDYEMYARPIDEYPAKSRQAAAIMAMIQNNLDPRVAQHPHELIIYGGNGAIFQNWAQYRLAMKYLAEMTDEQTLAMYSGHPMGLFPSHKDAPRVVVTNGMVIPNYSKQDDWERFNAMGVSQYGQMTAGSYMYIGPQGIVHGTTITVMNAARKQLRSRGIEGTQENMKGTRAELNLIKYDQRTSLFTTTWARDKFASIIQLKVLKECVQIIQVEIEKIHDQWIYLTEVHEDI